MVRPIIHTQLGTFRVDGTSSDAATCFEDADTPEAAAGMVWSDIRNNVALSVTPLPNMSRPVWQVFNPAVIFYVTCRPFD